jgi:hypothetical protein
MRFTNIIIKSITQKVMPKSGFGNRFHDLKYFEVGIFFHIPLIHYKLEGKITKSCQNSPILCILSYFKHNLDNYVFNKFTCILLALSLKICRLFLKQVLSI